MKIRLQHRSWISGIGRRGIHAALGFVCVLVACAVALPSAHAQTYTESVLYSFIQEPDGAFPSTPVIPGAAGYFYGATSFGGSGFGTVFKVDSAGSESVLYSFTAASAYPEGGLVEDTAGNLYGTTSQGGAFGWGSVFRLSTTGIETTLYSFAGPEAGPDGALPMAGLARDPAGNLYGTTQEGGTYGYGTVFKVSAMGKETVLASFDGANGEYPQSALLRDKAGNLYGTTTFGAPTATGLSLR